MTSGGLPDLTVLPQNDDTEIVDFDLPGITKSIDARISEEDCTGFSEAILNQLSKGKGPSLYEVFDAFFNQKHDLFTRVRPPQSRGQATALGSLKNSTATMFLRKAASDLQTLVDADNVIHELFHFAGVGFKTYTDEQLARALDRTQYAAAASEVFPDGTANIFDPRFIPGDSKADDYSTYFHGIAARYCGLSTPNTFRKVPKGTPK